MLFTTGQLLDGTGCVLPKQAAHDWRFASRLLKSVRRLLLYLQRPVHGRRKRGVCRGSDTPTIYVGDIDMYIPLENLIPSHANCTQHVLRCWERQSDGSEHKKTLRRPPRTPLRELTALPQTP